MKLKWEKLLPLGIFLTAFAALRGASIYGLITFGLLGVKLALSLLSKPAVGSPAGTSDHVVTVVVPVYNEDPELFVNCLRSLVGQSRRPDKIHVVDDGSTSRAAVDAAEPTLAEARRLGIRTEVTIFPRNRGKREAQGVVFRASPEATVFLTVDSDTVLSKNALKEGLKPFDDGRVTCVTGLVMAINSERNLLTRLIHLRYVNAFMWERAAYSMMGSVLCACGALALYRADVIRRHLDDFLTQRFLGRPAVFGDDRRLTNYALLHGRAVLQPTAVGYTAVPERIRHFIRQQIRWNKSFMRESVWVVQNMSLRSTAFWLTFAELSSWVVFTLTLTITLLMASFHSGLSALGTYLILVCMMSYVRSAQYFSAWRAQSADTLSGLLTYLIAPLYGALHLLLLLPLRTYAALTLFSAGWGTRGHVEVRADGSATTRLPPLPRLEPPRPEDLSLEHTGGPELTGGPEHTGGFEHIGALEHIGGLEHTGAAVWDPARDSESALRIRAALDAWEDGEFEAAAMLLEPELHGPRAASARKILSRLGTVVSRLSRASAREYERRLVPMSEDWVEVRDGFLQWAETNVIGRPLPADAASRLVPALAGAPVSSIRAVRQIRVVSADVISKEWVRLTLDVEAAVTGVCALPRELLGGLLAGDVVRLLEIVDDDRASVEWEGRAALRVTLEARIVAQPRPRLGTPASPVGDAPAAAYSLN